MIDLRSRVRARLEELNRNPFDAARVGGLNKHFIDDLLIGKKDTVKETSLPKLAKALDWTLQELLAGGEGIDIAIDYDADYETARGERNEKNKTHFYDSDGRRLNIPAEAIREVDVAAGLGGGQIPAQVYTPESNMADAYKRESWVLPSAFLNSSFRAPASAIIAIATRGDSMSPTISHGDVAFVDTRHRRVSPSGLYAIRDIYGEIVIKRLDAYREGDDLFVTISSDNAAEPKRMERLMEISVVGRVCGIMRPI